MDPDFRRLKRPAKSVTVEQLPLKTETPVPETFQTPEAIAAIDAALELTAADSPQPAKRALTTPSTEQWYKRFITKIHANKKEWLVSTIIVLVCGSILGFVLIKTDKKPVVSADRAANHTATKSIAKPTTVASTLSGLPVAPSANQQPVTAVMVENSLQARPQAGLSQAGVIFEAIAEGGITRFMALYQDTSPDNVGPVRSARPYYEQWALGFDAGYAHVGGSPEALAAIKSWGVRDLDQFYNSGSYHRISSRAAPHNVYTGIATLNQLEAGKGYATSHYSGFVRKAEAPSKQPVAKNVNLKLSGPLYDVHYDYDPGSNSYLRSEGGAAHVDANTNAHLSPKVVIALVMPYRLEADGYHSDYSTIGSGSVNIFQDGAVTTGQWNKPDAASQFTFTDATGKLIKINPGQTWLTAVSASANVSYTP